MFNKDKQIRIPKEFTLFGHKYKVVVSSSLFDTTSCYGLADDDTKVIEIQDTREVIKRSEEDGVTSEYRFFITNETMIETFFHELTHAILDALGEEELSNNEKFVNMMGKAWLEIYLSAQYEETPCEQKV